jgi:hypothetical protein
MWDPSQNRTGSGVGGRARRGSVGQRIVVSRARPSYAART